MDFNEVGNDEGDHDNVTQIRNCYDFKNSIIRKPLFHNVSFQSVSNNNTHYEMEDQTEKIYGDKNRQILIKKEAEGADVERFMHGGRDQDDAQSSHRQYASSN